MADSTKQPAGLEFKAEVTENAAKALVVILLVVGVGLLVFAAVTLLKLSQEDFEPIPEDEDEDVSGKLIDGYAFGNGVHLAQDGYAITLDAIAPRTLLGTGSAGSSIPSGQGPLTSGKQLILSGGERLGPGPNGQALTMLSSGKLGWREIVVDPQDPSRNGRFVQPGDFANATGWAAGLMTNTNVAVFSSTPRDPVSHAWSFSVDASGVRVTGTPATTNVSFHLDLGPYMPEGYQRDSGQAANEMVRTWPTYNAITGGNIVTRVTNANVGDGSFVSTNVINVAFGVASGNQTALDYYGFHMSGLIYLIPL